MASLRPSEKMINRLIKEEDGDVGQQTKHEDFAKVKEALDGVAMEAGVEPVAMEDDDDMIGGKYVAKGESKDAAEAFAQAAEAALAPHCSEASSSVVGNTATVEYKYK